MSGESKVRCRICKQYVELRNTYLYTIEGDRGTTPICVECHRCLSRLCDSGRRHVKDLPSEMPSKDGYRIDPYHGWVIDE
jgi:hypothetical protein